MKSKLTLNETVREALGIALFQIMATKPFCDITIREIATAAGVSRTSFYRNFATKEELLRGYIMGLYHNSFEEAAVLPCTDDLKQMRDFLEPRFRFVKEHRDIYRALYRNDLLYHFHQQMEDNIIRLLCGEDKPISPYHCAMLSGAGAGIIRRWIESDFREDEATMAGIFAESFQNILASGGGSF
jgi:AcrR family transcriptional regulator